jgi:prepilin-type N-terminal cleavage/methylation domain-containing protein
MKNNFSNSSGFTLLELLVAVCLLSIGIFSVITMQITAIKSNSIANVLSAANMLAQETMEDIMSWDISDTRVNPPDTVNAVYDLNGPNVGGTDITITGAGTFRASYSTVTNTPSIGTTQITVNIYKVTNGVAGNTPLTTLTGYKRVT